MRLLATALLALAGFGGAAAPAEAGRYVINVCQMPDGRGLPLELQGDSTTKPGWTVGPSFHSSAPVDGCTGGGPLELFMGYPGAPAGYRIGTAASWHFRLVGPYATTPLSIARLAFRHTVETRWTGASYKATPAFNAWAQAPNRNFALETCAAFAGCQVGQASLGDHPQNDGAWAVPAGVTGLTFEVICGGDTGGGCVNDTEFGARAKFWRLQIHVDDPVPPKLDGAVSGTATDGAQSGIRNLRARFTDEGAGVHEVVVRIGDREVFRGVPDPNGGRCLDAGGLAEPDFTVALPCPDEVNANVPVDTKLVPDGTHVITLSVVDAGGNAQTVWDRTVQIDNVPGPSNTKPPTVKADATGPRPGDTVEANPGSWTGAGLTFAYQWQRQKDAVWADIPQATKTTYVVAKDDVAHGLRVRVVARNVEGSAEAWSEGTAKVRTGATILPQSLQDIEGSIGAANGQGGNPATGQLVVDREQRQVDVKHGAKIVITGRLMDADNRPIADADVDVFEQLAVTAAPWLKAGTIKTDSQGGYVYRPRTTASRRLRFAYADRRAASDYRATREVFISVRARVTAKAQKRVVKPRGLIRLRGKVFLDGLPKSGAWVEVQVLDTGGWRTVGTRRVSSRGQWNYKHRLRRSSGISFRFRARLREAADVPSAEAKSLPVRVRVR